MGCRDSHLVPALGQWLAVLALAGIAGAPPTKPKTETLLGGFRITSEGVFYAGDDGEARPVCSRLEILARTRDDKGHNWGLLVELDDPDGDKKRWNISGRSMAGDFGKEVLGPLVDMGLRLAGTRSGRNARNDLQSYLNGFDGVERARLVTRLGWHGNAYLLPDQQIVRAFLFLADLYPPLSFPTVYAHVYASGLIELEAYTDEMRRYQATPSR